jgi:hypothetical protein
MTGSIFRCFSVASKRRLRVLSDWGCEMQGFSSVPCFHLAASISAWGIDVGQAVEIHVDDGLERLGR